MDTPHTADAAESQEISPKNGYISRRERRMLERQGQRGILSSQRRKRLVRRIAIWGIGIGALVGLGWGVVQLSSDVQLPGPGGALASPVTDADHTIGPDNAPITLVEYSDYQCPACRTYFPIVKQFLAEPDAQTNVRFVYRNFPLTQIHPNAQLSAQAAEAAALQDKFWEMHDLLFENQPKWSGMSSAGARSTFEEYATTLGLDIQRFRRDIDSDAVKDKIRTDVAGANASNVNATPTFFVNGVKMAQPESYEQFRQFILSGRGVQ